MARKKKAGFEFIGKLASVLDKRELSAMKKRCQKGGVNWRDVIPQVARGILLGDGSRWLSIQASVFHYCSPQLTLDYDMYNAFELAICERDKYMSARDLLGAEDKFAEMLDSKYFNGQVFAFVPVEHIEKLYQECKKRFGVLGG